MAAFSPLGQDVTTVLRVPIVSDGPWRCKDASGKALASQVLALDSRTRELPRLYLNAFNLTKAEYKAADAALTNDATAVLAVSLPIKATGAATAACGPGSAAPSSSITVTRDGDKLIVDNGLLRLTFCTATKALTTIENLASRTTTSLKLTWGWYNSSVGGCTPYPDTLTNVEPACSSQASGAYIFRPNSSELFGFDPSFVPQMAVETGSVYAEVRLRGSPFTSHTTSYSSPAPLNCPATRAAGELVADWRRVDDDTWDVTPKALRVSVAGRRVFEKKYGEEAGRKRRWVVATSGNYTLTRRARRGRD